MSPSKRHKPDTTPPVPLTGVCPDCGLRMRSHPPERAHGPHPALCAVARARIIQIE